MTKRISLFVVSAMLLLSSMAWALSSTDLRTVPIGKVPTPASFAKQYGLSTVDLIRLNHGLALRHPLRLIAGEQLLVNLGADSSLAGVTIWQFAGGDPAGPSLDSLYEQGADSLLRATIAATFQRELPLMVDVPDDVREWFRSQLEWSQARVVTYTTSVDDPLIIHGLAFGKGAKLKYWSGEVLCLWKDPVQKKQPVSSQHGLTFDPVQSADGYQYQLVVFLGCQNATTIRTAIPPPAPLVVAERETTVVDTTPAPPPPPPPPPPAPVVSTPELRAPEYNKYYVAWLTDEDVTIDSNGKPYSDRHQNHVFVGQEFGIWNASARYGLRVRNAEAVFELNKSRARSGDHNAGLVVVPFNRHFRLDLEAGLGYSAIQRGYTVVDHPNEYTWTWAEHKLTTDGFGPYVRTQWLLPGHIYSDLKWRNHGVVENYGGFVTARPGWFYAKVAYDHQVRPMAHRRSDGRVVPFAADTIIMREARLGAQIRYNLLVYGSYQRWEYGSGADNNGAMYWFTRQGPGGGFELNLTPTWRLDGNYIRFTDDDHARFHYGPGWADILSHNHEHRFKLGLVFQPTWH